ncbi:hypothetical protein OG333_23740 [Streptomyces anulatus]|uniref:hypothetical protein n=1 Tax=Streptomyces anulatus TaxID=1892 RepID=UPI0033E4DF96|nr:hypothetical protein OG333_23740 [Streptomyces anulatus]
MRRGSAGRAGLGRPAGLTGLAGLVVTRDFVSTGVIAACDPYTAHPRPVARIAGDWR